MYKNVKKILYTLMIRNILNNYNKTFMKENLTLVLLAYTKKIFTLHRQKLFKDIK